MAKLCVLNVNSAYPITQYTLAELNRIWGHGNIIGGDQALVIPGDDYLEVIENAILQSVGLVAFVTPRWFYELSSSTTGENYYQRLLLEKALANQHRVVMLLLENVHMPVVNQLPDTLGELVYAEIIDFNHQTAPQLLQYLMPNQFGEHSTPNPAQPRIVAKQTHNVPMVDKALGQQKNKKSQEKAPVSPVIDRPPVVSSGKVNDVFISYSRADADKVRVLQQKINERDIRTWADWNDIPATANWIEEIYAGIKSANTFVFMLTDNSLKSFVCHMELAKAIETKRRLIFVFLREPGSKSPDKTGAIVAFENFEPDTNQKTILEGRDLADVLKTNWAYIDELSWIIFEADGSNFTQQLETLEKAIKTDLEYLRTHTRLHRLAEEWVSKNHEGSLLLGGRELRSARKWHTESLLDNKDPVPNAFHQEFIDASMRRLRRRQTFGGIIAAIVLVVIFIIGLEALNQSNERKKQEETANALQLLDNAQAALDRGDSQIALALALEANSFDNPPQRVQTILANAAFRPGPKRVYENIYSTFTALFDASLSPDGKLIAGVSVDDTIAIWDAKTGEPLKQFTSTDGKEFTPYFVVFAPDSKHLIVGTTNGSVEIWEIASETRIQSLELSSSIESIELDADGNYILASDSDGIIYYWDYASDVLISTMTRHRDGATSALDDGVPNVNFMPDGTRGITMGHDGTSIIFDLATGEVLKRNRLSASVYDLALAPDETSGYITLEDKGIYQIDLETGAEIQPISEVPYIYIDLNPNGQLIAANTGFVETIDILNVDNGTRLSRITFEDTVETFKFIDDSTILVALANGKALMWDLTPGIVINSFQAQTTINAFAIKGDFLAYANEDIITLWDKANQRESLVLNGHDIAVTALEFNNDGSYLASGDENGDIIIWNTETGSRVFTFNEVRTGHSSLITGLKFDQTNSYLVSSAQAGLSGQGLIVWDIRSGVSERENDLISNSVNDIVLSEDGKTLVSVGFEATNWGELNSPKSTTLSSAGGDHIALSQDNQWYVTAGNRSISIRKMEGSFSSVNSDTLPAQITSIAVSQDNRAILAGLSDGSIAVVDANTAEVILLFDLANSPILRVMVEDEQVIVAAEDGSIQEIRLITDKEALIDWVRDNRYIEAINCNEYTTYDIKRACSEKPEYREHLAFATLQPLPTATFSSATSTPRSTQTTEPPVSTQITQAIEFTDLPFEVRVPETSNLKVDGGEVLSLEEAASSLPGFESLIGFGDAVYELTYYHESQFAGTIYLSQSPYASIDEWKSNLGVLGRGITVQNIKGIPTGILDVGAETRIHAFIYNGTFVSIFISFDNFQPSDSSDLIAAYIGDDQTGVTDGDDGTTLDDFGDTVDKEGIDGITYDPYIPDVGNDFKLVNVITVDSANDQTRQMMELLFNSTNAIIRLEYTHSDVINDEIVTRLIQTTTEYQNTQAWYDGDPIISGLADLITINGVDIVSIDGPQGFIYLMVKDGYAFGITDPTSRTRANQFVSIIASGETITLE